MKKIRTLKFPILLLISIIVGILAEIIFFQSGSLMMKMSGIRETVVDLSQYDAYNGQELWIDPEEASYSFGNLLIDDARSVSVTFAGEPAIVYGTFSFCDDSSLNQTQGAGHFSVNPCGSMNSVTTRIHSYGPLTRLRINLDDPDNAVAVTELVFNRVTVRPSLVRILLFALLMLLALCIGKYHLHTLFFDPMKRSHRLAELLVIAACMLFSLLMVWKFNPQHRYLTSLPSAEVLAAYDNQSSEQDAYAEQFDAFLKGQLHLDIGTDPRLVEMENPYDRSLKHQADIKYHFDRAFYDGKYYSYFGLAPMLIYAPVYAVTGQIPTASLVVGILILLLLPAAWFALKSLMKYFRVKANLLLYLLGIPAVMSGGMLFMLGNSVSFYYYPLLSGLLWLCIFTGVTLRAFSEGVIVRRQRILLILSGISVVMIVLSRPNLMLLAVVLAAPLFIRYLLSKDAKAKDKLIAALCFLIPTMIGGAGVCLYNYARFGSFTEFGTSYQMTESNIRYNSVSLSLHHLKSTLYHYFVQPFDKMEFFPYIKASTEGCFDFGNYKYFEINAGIFAIPVNLGIFLSILKLRSGRKNTSAVNAAVSGKNVEASGKNAVAGKSPLRSVGFEKIQYICLLAGIVLLAYIDYMIGGIHLRYTCDIALITALFSVLLILENVSWENTRASHILYVIVCAVLAVSVIMGLLLVFSNEFNTLGISANQDFYLKVGRLFRNW